MLQLEWADLYYPVLSFWINIHDEQSKENTRDKVNKNKNEIWKKVGSNERLCDQEPEAHPLLHDNYSLYHLAVVDIPVAMKKAWTTYQNAVLAIYYYRLKWQVSAIYPLPIFLNLRSCFLFLLLPITLHSAQYHLRAWRHLQCVCISRCKTECACINCFVQRHVGWTCWQAFKTASNFGLALS